MFSLKKLKRFEKLQKPKKMIHVVIKDYVIRVIETDGQDKSSASLFAEKALPFGLIENGKITDEIAFYQFMQELVKEFDLKNCEMNFVVPHSLVIMRTIEIPAKLEEKSDMLAHIEKEFGTTIHLPFNDPVFDISYSATEKTDDHSAMREVTIFAAPGEEMRKYTEIFLDASLKPLAADIGILGDYRYFNHTYDVRKERVYLLAEFNGNAVYLGIFKNHQLEFIRYQELDLELKSRHNSEKVTWFYTEGDEKAAYLMQEQVEELGRIMNFYRFSMNKGESAVTDIVLLGDYPQLKDVYNQISEQYDLQVTRLQGKSSQTIGQDVNPIFIPLLGLALKGDTNNASRN